MGSERIGYVRDMLFEFSSMPEVRQRPVLAYMIVIALAEAADELQKLDASFQRVPFIILPTPKK